MFDLQISWRAEPAGGSKHATEKSASSKQPAKEVSKQTPDMLVVPLNGRWRTVSLTLLLQRVKDLDSGQRNGLPERGVAVNNHSSELVPEHFPFFPMEAACSAPRLNTGSRKCLLNTHFVVFLSDLCDEFTARIRI